MPTLQDPSFPESAENLDRLQTRGQARAMPRLALRCKHTSHRSHVHHTDRFPRRRDALLLWATTLLDTVSPALVRRRIQYNYPTYPLMQTGPVGSKPSSPSAMCQCCLAPPVFFWFFFWPSMRCSPSPRPSMAIKFVSRPSTRFGRMVLLITVPSSPHWTTPAVLP